MNKPFLALILSLYLCATILVARPVLAVDQTAKPQATRLLAWNGWNKTVSWFKSIIIPKKTTTTSVVPAKPQISKPDVVNQPKATVDNGSNKTTTQASPAPVVPVVKTPPALKILPIVKTPIVKTTDVLKTEPKVIVPKFDDTVLENKSVESAEDDQMKIWQLNGTEADYSKSEETTANFFLSDEKLKYLPDISVLLKVYPNLNIQDVNTKGDFVGCIAKNDWDLHRAFAKIKGKFYEIGAIEGIYSCAYGINDKGQVVGIYNYKEDEYKPFLWQKGKITKLPTFALKDGDSERALAKAINNSGVIVGMSRVQSFEKSGQENVHAVRWINGQIEDLVKDKPYINSWAVDINERDQILINSDPASIWQNGRTVTVNDLVPKLGEGEFVKVDGGFADEPEFVMDGSLRLRVDGWNPNIEIINGDEHLRPTLSHLRYYKVSLPDDIFTIKIKSGE